MVPATCDASGCFSCFLCTEVGPYSNLQPEVDSCRKTEYVHLLCPRRHHRICAWVLSRFVRWCLHWDDSCSWKLQWTINCSPEGLSPFPQVQSLCLTWFWSYGALFRNPIWQASRSCLCRSAFSGFPQFCLYAQSRYWLTHCCDSLVQNLGFVREVDLPPAPRRSSCQFVRLQRLFAANSPPQLNNLSRRVSLCKRAYCHEATQSRH